MFILWEKAELWKLIMREEARGMQSCNNSSDLRTDDEILAKQDQMSFFRSKLPRVRNQRNGSWKLDRISMYERSSSAVTMTILGEWWVSVLRTACVLAGVWRIDIDRINSGQCGRNRISCKSKFDQGFRCHSQSEIKGGSRLSWYRFLRWHHCSRRPQYTTNGTFIMRLQADSFEVRVYFELHPSSSPSPPQLRRIPSRLFSRRHEKLYLGLYCC